MPASSIRSPSTWPASIANGPSAATPIGALSPSAVRQRSATAEGVGSGSPSSSRSETRAGIAAAPPVAPASRTGARSRATSSHHSGVTDS